jgi:hypothetical protein
MNAMCEHIEREFTTSTLWEYRPDLGGWQYIREKDETIPYTAYTFYRYVGVGNFERIRNTFCLENMFVSVYLKEAKR